MKQYYILCMMASLLLASCSDSKIDTIIDDNSAVVEIDLSDIHSVIVPYAEEGDVLPETRANFAGDAFENGDKIRLRIIAPYSSSAEYGESTWGGSYDNWRLFQWNGSWTSVPGSVYDIDADFVPNGTPPSVITMPQATPYVFTATTWTEVVHHVISSFGQVGGSVKLSFSNIFKADQRRLENYKASDVLWAQQYLQTGSQAVYLSFEHKMAALCVDISAFTDDLDNEEGSEEIILTLEGMPDIDQQEVTIGNYYADHMYSKDNKFGDYYRTQCSYENNGKVLGIVVSDNTQLVQKPFLNLPQTGIYTGYKDGNKFYFIIPPYDATGQTPTLWLRQGEKRWSAPLPLPIENNTFESGKRYNVTMTKS